ncbi:hypothetical protein [Rufibacter ruber]|uniref:hypothetical protein n=1 Tax=Rufibacter ruber TaxID=1783499 RepID=UPI000835B15A|nr:hypothetical protein [Rufibacter ruber]
MAPTAHLEEILQGILQEEDISQLVDTFTAAFYRLPYSPAFTPELEEVVPRLYTLLCWLLMGQATPLPDQTVLLFDRKPWRQLLHQTVATHFHGRLAELVIAKLSTKLKNLKAAPTPFLLVN